MKETSPNTPDKHDAARTAMRDSTRRLLNKKAVAAYCGVTERCIDNWRWERKFPTVKIGRVTRFDLSEVDAWLESNRETPAA